jgi:hypothetical protein
MRGSIRSRQLLRPPGKRVYDVVVDVPRGGDGKRRQRWVRGLPNRKAAEAKLDEVLREVRGGTYVQRSKTTLTEYHSSTPCQYRRLSGSTHWTRTFRSCRAHTTAMRDVIEKTVRLVGFCCDQEGNEFLGRPWDFNVSEWLRQAG